MTFTRSHSTAASEQEAHSSRASRACLALNPIACSKHQSVWILHNVKLLASSQASHL